VGRSFTDQICETTAVSHVRCPDCLEMAAIEADRTITDQGLERTYECEQCGNVWTVCF